MKLVRIWQQVVPRERAIMYRKSLGFCLLQPDFRPQFQRLLLLHIAFEFA